MRSHSAINLFDSNLSGFWATFFPIPILPFGFVMMLVFVHLHAPQVFWAKTCVVVSRISRSACLKTYYSTASKPTVAL